MRTAITTVMTICCFASIAPAQEPRETPPDVRPLPVVPAPKPALGETDKTLLDDTDAAGLKARPADAPPKWTESLPVGKTCAVYTTHGQFTGVLAAEGKWIVLQTGRGGQRTWIAPRQVVAIQQLRVEEDARHAAPDAAQAETAELRAQVARLQQELKATQEKLAQVLAEATQAREEAESQRNLAERVRQKAEEARRAAEQELELLFQQLKKAMGEAAK